MKRSGQVRGGDTDNGGNSDAAANAEVEQGCAPAHGGEQSLPAVVVDVDSEGEDKDGGRVEELERKGHGFWDKDENTRFLKVSCEEGRVARGQSVGRRGPAGSSCRPWSCCGLL